MVTYIEGNIFSSPAQVIVNTVNTVGVMGKGLALSFKKRYPGMFEVYRRACERKQLTIGKLMLYYAPDHWILMFPTKENWRNPSKLEYIEAGLQKFVSTYAQKNITSIAFPKLGCGNGELSWDAVKPLMEKYLKPLPIAVYIYVGIDAAQTPEHLKQEETADWLRAHARDMSFAGLCDDLKLGQAILPYQLEKDGVHYAVRWADGLVYSADDGRTFALTEDDLFALWDAIRRQGVFAADAYSAEQQMFFLLLWQKGYLSPVQIVNGQDSLSAGYQTNEGLGRFYAVRGEEA